MVCTERHADPGPDRSRPRAGRMFAEAQTPQRQPLGEYAGSWLATTLPHNLDVVLSGGIRRARLWRGKRFFPGGGTNVVVRGAIPFLFAVTGGFRGARGVAEAAPFAVRRGRVVRDRGDAWLLDYDVAANRWPLRGLCDEVRLLHDGRWIGRATLRLSGERNVIGFFLLAPGDGAPGR